MGDSAGAKEDFEKSLDLVPDYVQSLVKVASVHMEMGMSNWLPGFGKGVDRMTMDSLASCWAYRRCCWRFR